MGWGYNESSLCGVANDAPPNKEIKRRDAVMKRVKLLLCSVCIFALMLCAVPAGAASKSIPTMLGTEEHIPFPTDYDKEFYATQWESIQAYAKLLESFSEDIDTCTFSDTGTNAARYPGYFGGAYINDNGELVILTTDMSDSAVEEIQSTSGSNTIVLPCSVSLNEMLGKMELIQSQWSYLDGQGVEITMLRDDILSGAIMVGIKNLTDEKKAAVQSIADCNYLKFQDSDRTCETNTTISAGAGIYDIGSNISGTVGFSAIRENGTKGIVTAGHVASKRNDRIIYNGESVGIVRYVSYHNKMTADASFILTDSDVTLTSTVVNGYRIVSAITSELPIGTVVSMYGVVSGLTSGKIISYNVSGFYSGSLYEYSGFANASYTSQNGDSGGPILVYNGASNYSLVGIHSGSNKDNTSVFTPYKNIVKALDVTCVPYYAR